MADRSPWLHVSHVYVPEALTRRLEHLRRDVRAHQLAAVLLQHGRGLPATHAYFQDVVGRHDVGSNVPAFDQLVVFFHGLGRARVLAGPFVADMGEPRVLYIPVLRVLVPEALVIYVIKASPLRPAARLDCSFPKDKQSLAGSVHFSHPRSS